MPDQLFQPDVIVVSVPGTQGAVGPALKIMGTLASTADLPTPPARPEYAYLINFHIWSWNEATQAWVDGGEIRGPQGAKGDAATIALGTVATGAAGSNVVITNSGTPGAATFNFTIPRGDQGIQGIQGVKGDKGDAATLTLGTVTTGAAGTNASITNSGTSGAAVFNFTIPRGDKGEKGDTGPMGPAGGSDTLMSLDSTEQETVGLKRFRAGLNINQTTFASNQGGGYGLVFSTTDRKWSTRLALKSDASGVPRLSIQGVGSGTADTYGPDLININDLSIDILSGNTARIPLTVKGLAGQTADLQQWQDSAGVMLAKVEPTGRAQFAGTSLIPATVNNSGLAVFGNPSQTGVVSYFRSGSSSTATLTEWQDSAGATLTKVGSDGAITMTAQGTLRPSILIGTSTWMTAELNIQPHTTTRKGIVVRGLASQAENLQEWQNSAGTVLAGVNSGGGITSTGIALTGTAPGGTGGAAIRISGISPTMEFDDTDQASGVARFWLHVNSGSFYILADDGDDGTWNTPHPLQITGRNATFGGTVTGTQIWDGSNRVWSAGNVPSTMVTTDTAQTITGAKTFAVTNAAHVPAVFKGAPGQTSDLVQWQDSSGTVLSYISSNGDFTATSKTVSVGYLRAGNAGWIDAIPLRVHGLTNVTTSVIRAATSQTADLTQWQNDAGTVVASISNIGALTVAGSVSAGGEFRAGYAGYTDPATGVAASAKFRGNSASVGIIASPGTASNAGIVIRGLSSQTANLQEWQNSAGTVLASVNASGQIFEGSNRVYSAGNKVPVSGISATGTPGAGNFLRGDGSWQAINISNMVTTDTAQTITATKTISVASSGDGLILQPNSAASSGSGSLASPSLYLTARYWDGSASVNSNIYLYGMVDNNGTNRRIMTPSGVSVYGTGGLYDGSQRVYSPNNPPPAKELTYRATTTATTAIAEEFLAVDATSGALTITLPTAPATGTRIGIKKVDATANIVTVAPPAGVTIDGDVNATIITQWAGATFVYTGTNWLLYAPTYAGKFPAFQIGGSQPANGSGVIWLRPVT